MKTTGIVITGILIFIGLYDLVVVVKNGVGTSVSQFIIDTGCYSPLFVFLCGGLFGHLFLSMRPGIYHIIKDLEEFKLLIDKIGLADENGVSSIKRQETISEMYSLYKELKKCRKC